MHVPNRQAHHLAGEADEAILAELSRRIDASSPGDRGCRVFSSLMHRFIQEHQSYLNAISASAEEKHDGSHESSGTCTKQLESEGSVPAENEEEAAKLDLPWLPIVESGSFPHRIFLLLDDPSESRLGQIISILIMILIILSTCTFLMESVEDFHEVTNTTKCTQLIAEYNNNTAASPSEITVREACEPKPLEVFYTIETVCITIFTIEYIPRILTVSSAMDSSGIVSSISDTVGYMCQPMNVIDLAAIVPFYIELIMGGGGGGLAVLRVLRLARVFRIFKMGKYNQGLVMILLVAERSAMAITLLLFFMGLIVVLFRYNSMCTHTTRSSFYIPFTFLSHSFHNSSSLMYFAESSTFNVSSEFASATCTSASGVALNYANASDVTCEGSWGAFVRPTTDGRGLEKSPFTSIPLSMWWCMTTITTVGYGDYYPTSIPGKVVGVISQYGKACAISQTLELALHPTNLHHNTACAFTRCSLVFSCSYAAFLHFLSGDRVPGHANHHPRP
jgi:hypothetical protein